MNTITQDWRTQFAKECQERQRVHDEFMAGLNSMIGSLEFSISYHDARRAIQDYWIKKERKALT